MAIRGWRSPREPKVVNRMRLKCKIYNCQSELELTLLYKAVE